MNLQDFLSHHHIFRNPFAEEDAQTDPVFRDVCITSTYHPAWDKVFGDPGNPATAIVFGEKGAGKTALRLQVESHIGKYNREHPESRCFVVAYDDFNPILDHFGERFTRRARRPEKLLQHFRLWDHMDAILSLAVTDLVSRIIDARPSTRTAGNTTTSAGRGNLADDGFSIPKHLRKRLDTHQRRDLLLLAACYDNSNAAPPAMRWNQLRHQIGGGSLLSWWPWLLGATVTILSLAAVITFWALDRFTNIQFEFIDTFLRPLPWIPWLWVIVPALCWLPWLYRWTSRWWTALGIARRVRVMARSPYLLTKLLMRFSGEQLARQPLPNMERTDDRYAMLAKLQSILRALGFTGIVVLVDRLDEPHLINGSNDAMKALLWPMLDNKFLKQEGIGFKLLLPIELIHFIEREDADFHQRARLDKQNMVPSLHWTGQALYDVANSRLAACSSSDPPPKLMTLFDDATVSQQRLFDALQSLRVPRHVFRVLYRIIMAHCNKHSDQAPVYQIASDTFESELAVYRREQDRIERGFGG